MKLKISFILVFVMVISTLGGAQENKNIFLGIQPAITKEKFYDKDEFDANILPLVVEMPIAKRMNLRFTSIVNYHFGNSSKVSDVGIQAILPIFITERKSILKNLGGFYIAPVLGLGQNYYNKHFTTTLAVEPGYLFKTNNRFTVSLGIQYGGSHFKYESDNEWVEHFGVKANFGFWI